MNKCLGDGAIVHAQGLVRLIHQIPSDNIEFAAAVERGDVERAVSLYRGEFLPGFAVPGGQEFERWADVERRRLLLMFLRSAETLARKWLAIGRARDAQALARRVRTADPLDERGWRLLLETLIATNDAIAAAVEAGDLEAMFKAEDREPEPATRELLNMARNIPVNDEVHRRTLPVADLVGREREFAAIVAAWDSARAGAGRHVHVSAPAGIGKTRLLADVHARLRATGARVVTVRATIAERGVGSALAAELAARLCALPGAASVAPHSASLLVGLNSSLSSLYHVAPDLKGSDEELARRRGGALADALGAVAYEGPVALLIDDIHWSDAASRQMLAVMARTTADCRALIVTAARPGAETIPSDTALQLAPLALEQVRALLANLASLPPENWATSFAEALHATSQGSPLLILETLQSLLEDRVLAIDGSGWRCELPAPLHALLEAGGAVSRRVGQMDRDTGWILLLLAASGAPIGFEALVRAARRSESVLQSELALMEQQGLVQRNGEGWEPSHDEITHAALDRAGEPSRLAAHAALAASFAHPAATLDEFLRAGRHLMAANVTIEIPPIFQRAVTLAGAHRGARELRDLAQRFLGEYSDPRQMERLLATLPLRQRIPSHRLVGTAVGIALALIVGTATGLQLAKAPAPIPDAELLVVTRDARGKLTARNIPLERDRFPEVPVIQGASDGASYRGVLPSGQWSEATPSRDGRTWIVGRPVTDSGAGNDLFLLSGDSIGRRLTFARGDDLHATWAPDGRAIAFQTTRWNPHAWPDIAVLDLASLGVRRLTTADEADRAPVWSPDGSRIAFLREFADRRKQLCWVSADGALEKCGRGAYADGATLAGWRDQQTAVAVLDSDSSQRLVFWNVDQDSIHVILDDSIIGSVSLSPDGHWFACFCQSRAEGSAEWRVFPTDNTDRVATVHVPPGTTASHVAVLTSRPRAGPLERLVVRNLPDEIVVGVPERLFVVGYDSAGNVVATKHLSWRSADTSIATVGDTTGTIVPRRDGTTLIRVSAGGWVSAWFRIQVSDSAPVRVLTEDWNAPLESQWVPFGQPRPFIDVGPSGISAMNNNGDGTFESGVYSRRAFPGGKGIGLDVRLSTDVNAFQYQTVGVWLNGSLDSAVLSRWDHIEGYVPNAGIAGGGMCGAHYPLGDGEPATRPLATLGGSIALNKTMRTGAWYTLRIQVFPDGTCGVALNGTPVSRTPLSAGSRYLYRVLLQGSSVGTKMLVGPLEVWQGIRNDVDWSRLERRRLQAAVH